MTFLPAKRAHWIIPIFPMSLVPWVSSGALFPSAKGKLCSVYNFLTSISSALNKLGTQHNSPPVSKCKRVNSQGLGQTGTGRIMPGFIQGQLLLSLTLRAWGPSLRSWWLLRLRLGRTSFNKTKGQLGAAPWNPTGAAALGQIPQWWI